MKGVPLFGLEQSLMPRATPGVPLAALISPVQNPARSLHFVAGFQRGTFVGYTTAVRYVISEAHDTVSRVYRHRPHEDWALVELLDPVRLLGTEGTKTRASEK